MSNSGFKDRYGDAACPRCGAREVIPDAQLARKGDAGIANMARVVAYGRPEAWLFKKRAYSKVRARVCTACGHIDLYARAPDRLRDAYEQRNAPD